MELNEKILVSYLGHFPQGSPLLPKVYYHTAPSILSFFDRLLYSKDEIRAAGAYIRAKNVASVALESCE